MNVKRIREDEGIQLVYNDFIEHTNIEIHCTHAIYGALNTQSISFIRSAVVGYDYYGIKNVWAHFPVQYHIFRHHALKANCLFCNTKHLSQNNTNNKQNEKG